MDQSQHIALLHKKLQREKLARKEAEKLLEVKSHELYSAKKTY